MDGPGGVRLRRLVRQPGVRGADQGGDEGDDSRAARRGVSVGRGADDVPQVRPRGDRRGGMGQSVLTTGFARVDGDDALRGRVPRAHRPRRRNAGVRLQRRDDSRSLRAARPRCSRRCRIAFTTRSRPTRAAAFSRCCGSSAPASTSCRAASCIARCAPASRRPTSSSAASARRSARSPKRSTPAFSSSTPRARPRSGSSTGWRGERGIRGARLAARQSRDHARRAARLHQDRREGTQVRHSARRSRARRARSPPELPHVELVGLDMHLGSQLSRIDPYREGTERLASIFAELTKRGITRSSTSTSAAGSACATTPSSRPTCAASPS